MSEKEPEKAAPEFGNPPRKKQMRKMVCSICGHEWISYSYGLTIRCPECYKRATDKSYGAGAENPAKIRQRRQEIRQTAASPPAPTEPPKKPQSLLDKLLNWKIGG